MSKKKYCPDCGGSQVNHTMLYVSVMLSSIVDPWTNWLSRLIPEDRLEWIGPPLIKILTLLHIGSVTRAPKDDDSWRTRCLWEEAERRGIEMQEFRLFGIGRDIFISRYKG